MCSGLFTLIGALLIIAVTITIYVDIFTRKKINGDQKFQKFDIKDYKVSLSQFLDQTRLSFNVLAYDHWNLLTEPIDCVNVEAKLTYMVPSD